MANSCGRISFWIPARSLCCCCCRPPGRSSASFSTGPFNPVDYLSLSITPGSHTTLNLWIAHMTTEVSSLTTVRNPQANGILECTHQVIGNLLRSTRLMSQDLSTLDAQQELLAPVTLAINSTYHTTLQATPGQLAFQRDTIMPTTYLANWAAIQHRRQEQSIDSTTKENSSRIQHEYRLNDRVLIRRGVENPYLRTLARPTEGPYKIIDIEQLPINGTVLIQCTANTTERVNICRLVPFFEPSH